VQPVIYEFLRQAQVWKRGCAADLISSNQQHILFSIPELASETHKLLLAHSGFCFDFFDGGFAARGFGGRGLAAGLA
jgi:hypothetical protein